MSSSPLPILEGVRLSEMARCPRMAAYRGLGAEVEEPTEEQRRYLTRGQVFGIYVAEQYAAKHGRANVTREAEIAWPHGTGHADVLVKPERLIVEVFSTVTPKGASVKDKIEQVKQYVRFSEDADVGAVHVVNPSDLSRERLLPVFVSEHDVARIDRNVADVGAALRGGPLPARVCEKPSDAIGKFCPFADTCFADWEAPPVIELDGDHAQLARQLYDVEARVRGLNEHLSIEKKARETLREMVEPLVPAGRVCRAGDVTVKRTATKPRVTYDTPAALAAGIVTADQMEPFRSEGKPGSRWTVGLEEPAA